jgi:hypothetical protein
MSPVSRGFRRLHRAPAGQESRLPPGQHVTEGFPVLSAGPTPHTPLEKWTFSITQGGQGAASECAAVRAARRLLSSLGYA